MRDHHLKTWPEPFAAILSGQKRHEVRRDDRGFAVGDNLILSEWLPGPFTSGGQRYTGRVARCRVTYISPAGTWGLPSDLCVMSVDFDAAYVTADGFGLAEGAGG